MTSHHDVAGVVAELRDLAAEQTLKCWEPRHGDWMRALKKSADFIESQAKALSEAERERDEANKELANFLDPRMESMRLEDGRFDVALCGKAVERIAMTITGWFRESGAKNYVEMTLNARDEPFEQYTFTVQKRGDGAQSPHELRLAAEARLAEAMKVIEPFALVAEHDIGLSETDADTYRPMTYNTVPNITVGHLRAARAFTNAAKEKT